MLEQEFYKMIWNQCQRKQRGEKRDSRVEKKEKSTRKKEQKSKRKGNDRHKHFANHCTTSSIECEQTGILKEF